ncbi:hypothetical protein DPEC_G00070780 [Dallia pectoralis]|uniref:Uncharacterized protein n=1 Tax=Dallia pectoralis TaxID=75939 RepID=A0ACC2H1Y1_DALPE|nr:hypothetical protein DPEC_G00070780 [Dallia pectoralis]
MLFVRTAPARGRKSGPAGQRQRTETDINTTSRQRKELTNPTYTRSERTTGQYLSDHMVGAPRWICSLSGCPSSTITGHLPQNHESRRHETLQRVEADADPNPRGCRGRSQPGTGNSNNSNWTSKKTRQHDDPPGIQQVQYQWRTPVSSTQMADGAGCSQVHHQDLTTHPAPIPTPPQHPEEAERRDVHQTFTLSGLLTGEFNQ